MLNRNRHGHVTSDQAYALGAPAHDCDLIPDHCAIDGAPHTVDPDGYPGYMCGHSYGEQPACAHDLAAIAAREAKARAQAEGAK
jgi:hypothetical protein